MHLTQKEIELFYKLWNALTHWINETHKIIPSFKKPVYGTRSNVSLQEFALIRNKMWENPQWIDEFLSVHNNGEFTEIERDIIASWRKKFLKKRFKRRAPHAK